MPGIVKERMEVNCDCEEVMGEKMGISLLMLMGMTRRVIVVTITAITMVII